MPTFRGGFGQQEIRKLERVFTEAKQIIKEFFDEIYNCVKVNNENSVIFKVYICVYFFVSFISTCESKKATAFPRHFSFRLTRNYSKLNIRYTIKEILKESCLSLPSL
jgi:hypothetical protein